MQALLERVHLVDVVPTALLLYWVATICTIALLTTAFCCGGHRSSRMRLLLQHGKTLRRSDGTPDRATAGLPWNVPKHWFLHFYAVGALWQAVLWWLVLDSLLGSAPPLLRALMPAGAPPRPPAGAGE